MMAMGDQEFIDEMKKMSESDNAATACYGRLALAIQLVIRDAIKEEYDNGTEPGEIFNAVTKVFSATVIGMTVGNFEITQPLIDRITSEYKRHVEAGLKGVQNGDFSGKVFTGGTHH
jgi:hypothetical protein